MALPSSMTLSFMCPSNAHSFHLPAWPGSCKWNWARPGKAPGSWEQEDWLHGLYTVFVDQRRLRPSPRPQDTATRCCGLFIQSLWDTMKDSVTAHQNGYFCNFGIMCAHVPYVLVSRWLILAERASSALHLPIFPVSSGDGNCICIFLRED